jgi:acetyl-CoA decarbonylase/synthase complex subunit epsilon
MASETVDTTRNAIPFDRANITGPKSARPTKADVAGKLIAKAKRPLLIAGTSAGDEGVLEIVKVMAEKGIPVASTGSSMKRFAQAGIKAKYVNLHALVSYLKDPNWKGFDGKGGYDTAIFLGHTYYHASQLISTLKNFSSINVISIDRYYHPNAKQSFGNLKKEDHVKALHEVADQL